MSLHNQDSQHVTNKASSSLFVNQSTAGAPSMAKQIAKNTAPSNSNKYSTLNINNQFKGKGIEPQQKTTVMRSAPTGMQTLGKAVAARRMPPPAHLPSLRTFNSSPTQSVESASNETSSGSQTSNCQSGAPTIAAVVSGSPWAHDSNPNSSFEPNTRTFNRNNSINQEDFPKLDETIQQNAAKAKQEGGERVQESVVSDEPVFKPANLGNWSARTPVQSVDEPEAPEPVRPAQSQSPAIQVYQPPHNRSNNQYRPNKFQPNNHQNFRKYQAESKIDETRRPVLFNKNDSLVETNKENVTDSNKIDFSNLDENNWAMISDRVNYDEKLEFDDEEDMDKKSNSVKQHSQVDFEEQQWEDKRKEKQEEVEKNLERAKSRRDEEIKKLNQEMKNVFISDDQSCAKDSNLSRESVFKANHSNKQTNRSNNQTTNNNNRSSNNSRKNDDHAEHINRPNSRYQGSTNYSHQSHAFAELLHSNDKSEKASHHHQTTSNSQQRQSYFSQSFNQPSFQNQSNRYHQSNANQPNSKAPGSNSRYQNKKSDANQIGEQKTQSEQKKSLKQLSHNVPEIESKLQPLGSRKLPTQTNQNIINQGQTEKKTEPDSKTKTNNSEYQEPKQNVWNRHLNETNQDTQSKQVQNKQEQKNKYPQRSNQSYRNGRRRFEDEYEEDYDDDYDDYTEEDDEQYSQSNPNRTASNSGYPRRPNSSHYPQSYKRGSNRRANDFYQMESKNFYPTYSGRSYNYDYNYPKGYPNYNYRGGNSRNSVYASGNKVFYNSNTKNGGAKEHKEPQNRSRDQTSMTKYSEPTDTEIYDEWETASDTSLRHQVKKVDEPKNSLPKDPPKAKNQAQKQPHGKKSNNQKDFKSRKTSSNTNPNDPRYTAKYWSDNSKNEKSNEQKQQENRTKNNNTNTNTNSNNHNNNNNTQTRNGTNQAKVNLQVYRVDKIVADDPEAIKEALKNQNIKEKSATKTNPLSGIDLNNRAGVVIVDYIPESGEIAIEENSAEDEEKDDDDGFQKVKTKRDKKAEKLKAQAEAAAARLASANSTKRKEAKSSKKSASKTEPKTAPKANKNGIMNNIQTWKNDMAKPGAKAVTQVVKPAPAVAESKAKMLSDDLKKTTTNVWETNANKTEQNGNKVDKCAVEANKPIEKDAKSVESTTKPKEESSKEITLLKQDAQPSQKNVCTVKPTKQVTQPLANEQKPNISVSVNGTGSGVVSPSPNQQLSENQSINKYYDKIMINQSSSAAVAASAAAAAAAVVAVTVTSIQQQQIPSGEQTDQTSAIKQSSSSSSIKNNSSSNASAQSESQTTNTSEFSQMTPNQPNYNFAPASTTSQTSLISSPSQTNSQISATSLIHSLSINQSMQPQYLQPIYQPMVQPFMSQSRPMVGPPQPPQSQSANPLIQNQQNKNNINSLFDLSFGEFGGAKEAMFYPPPPPPPPPHAQNYMGQIPPGSIPPPQTMPPHLPAQPINPYPTNGYEHNQFFNQKLLNSKPNGTFAPQPPTMTSSQFNGINSNIKSQFNQNTPNQLMNQMHQYSKQEFAYFNNQMPSGQSFAQAQGSNQPTPAPNSNNLGFFMSQIGNLNPNQFQAQAHATVSTQQSVFNMNQGQLSNNQLFGIGYNQPQQNSQFNLSNLIQTQQNQQQQLPNQTSAHRQTPISIPSSPFIQNDNQAENGFIKQQNGFDYKTQQTNQSNYARNGPNLAASKQMFSALEANNFDKNQQNKGMSQPNGYYRAIEQQVQNHYNQVGQIPPQQQPPLLPNPPIMANHNQLPNQIQVQSLNQKIGFNKAAGMPRYPNAYQNQNRPAQNQNAYYNQNYNRRSYPNYQNSGKKMSMIDAKVVQKNAELSQQSKQDGPQTGPQVVQTQTRGSTPNTIEEKNNECNANVI